MEKKELTNGIVEVDGIKTVAERTVEKEHVTYKPYRNYHKGLDVNQVVYDLMIIAAYDQLKMGQAVYAGDYTAAEMAGTVGYLYQFVGGEDYKIIRIKTETFCCSYHAGEAFAQMAEWEGVMSLAPKKYHRFAVEGKEMPSGVKLKPYTRCHGYKPRTISLAAENDRINKKLEVLGELRRRLSNEGMKKALAVLCAAKQWENNQARYRMALEVMRRRLWKDYGTDQYAGPMSYTARDFEPGPEIWKQVDTAYANMLRKLFCDMLNAAPAPKWISTKDYVQVKDKEKVVDKLQGKLYVTNVYARLDSTGEKLVWFANVVAAKGREWQFEVDMLEPWTEPEKAASKRGKNDACIGSSERKQARPEVKSKKQATGKPKATAKKTPAPNNSEVVTKQSASCLATTAEPTLEERLRAALLRQLKQAA